MPTDPATGAVIVPSSLTVAGARPADVVLSPDGLKLYTTGSDGNVRSYNAETGEFLWTLDVGRRLGALEVSVDGRYLFAVEREPLASEPQDDFGNFRTTVTVYRIDLRTGDAKSFPFVATGSDSVFSDVAALSDGRVLLTQEYNGSGSLRLKLLDPRTGTYSEDQQSADMRSVLTRSADGSSVLVGETNSSDAPIMIYRTGEGVVADHRGYADDVMNFNRGIQAVSTAGGLVAQHVPGNGLHIYDLELGYKRDLAADFPQWEDGTFGLAFDASGKFLFVLGSDEISQVSTTTWTVVRAIPTGDLDLYVDENFGNNLLLGPGLRFFTVVTESGLQRLDNPFVADALAGTARADNITGTGAAETLIGYDGNDQLDGRGGADTMIGGLGDDAYVVDVSSDKVIEIASGGADTVRSSVSFTLPTYVEKLILTGSGDANGRGNSGANSLTGNSGANRLDGGPGGDSMAGGVGSDTYLVDSAADVVSEAAGAGSDTVESSIDYTLGAELERLTLKGSALNGTGNAAANVLVGNRHDNVLNGAGGADRAEGGAGNDLYLVDSSGDRIVELSAQGNDSARASVSYTLPDNVEHLVLTGGGAVNATGNALANSLTGNGAANRVDGAGGADTMAGGAGHDTYVVDNVRDIVTENGSSGNDTVETSVDFSLPIHFEKLIITGTAGRTVRGNAGDNTITGNPGANTINGGSGDDAIDAGGGNDLVYGHTGNDTLQGGAGLDRFLFNTALGSANVDRLPDFSVAEDTINLARSIFTRAGANGTLAATAFQVGTAAADASDRIVFDQASGKIFYDPDGTGAATQVLFATVSVGTVLTNADFVIYG